MGPLVAGEPGFEPGYTAPKAAVLPLDESPLIRRNFTIWKFIRQTHKAFLIPGKRIDVKFQTSIFFVNFFQIRFLS